MTRRDPVRGVRPTRVGRARRGAPVRSRPSLDRPRPPPICRGVRAARRARHRASRRDPPFVVAVTAASRWGRARPRPPSPPRHSRTARTVAVVCTDGFLFPNRVLRRGASPTARASPSRSTTTRSPFVRRGPPGATEPGAGVLARHLRHRRGRGRSSAAPTCSCSKACRSPKTTSTSPCTWTPPRRHRALVPRPVPRAVRRRPHRRHLVLPPVRDLSDDAGGGVRRRCGPRSTT